MPFNTKEIPDQTNKVAVITGANTGIGYITALEIARKGGHVILACRSEERTLPAIEKIKKETGNDKVEFMKLDLTSMESVLSFAQEFKSKNLPLHTLVNNAGIMLVPFSLTKDGIESQIGTNHFGHALLTLSLFDVIEKSQPSRIVMLSSLAHTYPYSEGVIFDHINDESHYSSAKAYGQSKLCNVLFANSLADRVKDKQIYVNSVHPGYVATELQRNLEATWGSIASFFGKIGYALFALTPEQGALTSLYCATSTEIVEKNYRGELFYPIAKQTTASEFARSKELQEKLWQFTLKTFNEKLGDKFVNPFN